MVAMRSTLTDRVPAFRQPACSAVLIAVVALGTVAVSLAEGGYSPALTAALSVALWWTVILALVIGVAPLERVPGTALTAGIALAGIAGWTAASMLWANDAGRAFEEVVRVLIYLGLFTATVLFTRGANVRSWFYGFAIGIGVVVAFALGSRLQSWLPGDVAELATLLPDVAGRLSYPIGYWNGLAALAAIGTALLVWVGTYAPGKPIRAAAIAWVPACGLAIYLTSSRGGVIAALVAVVALAIVGGNRARLAVGALVGAAGAAVLVATASGMGELIDGSTTGTGASQGDQLTAMLFGVTLAVGLLKYLTEGSVDRLRVRRATLIPVAVVLGVIAAGGIVAADPVARVNELATAPDPEPAESFTNRHLISASGNGRLQFWDAAVGAFASDPVRGVGAGGYEFWWNQNGSIQRLISNAHSLFLEFLAELGVIGLALILVFFAAGVLATSGARSRARPEAAGVACMLAAGLVSASLDWTWEIPAVFAPLIVAVALGAGPLQSVSQAVGANATETRRRLALGVATLLVSWAALWASGVQFLTERTLDASRTDFNDGDLVSAAQGARDAAILQPWSPGPRLQSALIEESAGNLTAAEDQLDEAITRASEDWQLWFVAARLALADGRVADARADLARARELNGKAPIFAPDTTAAEQPIEGATPSP